MNITHSLHTKFFLSFFLAVFTFGLGFTVKAQLIDDDFVEGEIFVKVKPSLTGGFNRTSASVNAQLEIPTIYAAISKSQGSVEQTKAPFYKSKNAGLKNIYRIKLDGNTSLEEVLKDLKEDPSVIYAEPVRRRRIIGVPNDTLYNSQWHLEKIKAAQAWDINPGSQDVIVAVVDNAIQVNHIDLAGNMVAGYDVSDNDADPSPPNANFSHGTHVSGIVAAVNNNITGIASAGNNRVKVMPIKATSDASFYNFIDNGYEGISWAVLNGAKIISLSWGGGGYSQTEQDIIDDAHANGVIILAAAGNENSSLLQYPAAYEHVIAVASLDDDDARSSFSSYGTYVDIAAPGRGILSTIPFDAYASFSGTSMATPLVASCAGFLLSSFPTLAIDSIEIILKATADNIDDANPSFIGLLGTGRVNLLKAISCRQVDIFSSEPFVSPTNYFCVGDSATLSIAVNGLETFEWFFNDVSVSTTKDFIAKDAGLYALKRTVGACEVTSDNLRIVHNKVFTAKPTVTDLNVLYCEAAKTQLIGTPGDCTFFGPDTFDYSGPIVGFDGFLKSDDHLTAEVMGVAGLIDSITVSITWQKKDGGTHNNCDDADLGATAFNEEVSFQLVSPKGIRVDLVRAGDYGRGIATSGEVTTIFTPNGLKITGNPLPSNGTFGAAGNLADFEDQIGQGIWTLVTKDNATLDPLCVSGFSITVKTKRPASDPTISWYSDEGLSEFLLESDSLSVATNMVGVQNYYAVTTCEGLCPGPSSKSEVRINAVPDLYAFPISSVILSNSELELLAKSNNLNLTIQNDSISFISGQSEKGGSKSAQIASISPQRSPISVCTSESYIVFGLGCNGTIKWESASWPQAIYGSSVILNNVSGPLNISATCLQSWTCSALTDIPFQFSDGQTPLSLSGIMTNITPQNFYGGTVSSNQVLKSSSIVDYRAPQSILLSPGFETILSSVFTAEIANCPN
ncbi:MAG: serine protease [Arcticibacterium sp.]|jgi:serine protease